ncbi:MAG: AraC family transcriptional regulator [Gammaproteobacteria bacterium]|nr:AraC family transcriptional regulator [Gammaproteobacteria bacterium]
MSFSYKIRFDSINKYRVKETHRILVSNDSKYLSILDIAFAAGFNSKSGFYSAFGKHVGKTPGEYRKSFK